MQRTSCAYIPIQMMSLNAGILVTRLVRIGGRKRVRTIHITVRVVSVRYCLYRVIRDKVLLHAVDPFRITSPNGGWSPRDLMVYIVQLCAFETGVVVAVDVTVGVGALGFIARKVIVMFLPLVSSSCCDVQAQHEDEEYCDDDEPD